MFDFSKVIDRRNSDSCKWDGPVRFHNDRDIIEMGCADMDFQCAPEILDAMKAKIEHGVFGYAQLGPHFVEGIQEWYRTRHNAELPADAIHHSPRIVVSCSVVINTLTKPGDKIILNCPYYPPLHNAMVDNARTPIETPLVERDGKYTIDFDELESLVDENTKLMIFVSPHNPTTRVWSREELEKVADFCVRHNIYLFVDEIHSDFIRKGNTFTSMAQLDGPIRDRLIIVNSPAKSFNVMGLACSYFIIFNESLRNQILDGFTRAAEYDPNTMADAMMSVAYQKCGYYVDQCNEYIDANEDYLRKELTAILPKLKIKPREGTYLLWVDFSDVFPTEAETIKFLHEKVKINPSYGSNFSPVFSNFMRINMGCPRATLEEVVRRFKEAAKSL